jgi:hypothetical protein
VAPKRGERVAPPARAGEWTLVFGEKAAAEGWEELCRQAPGNTHEAWESISRNPRDRTRNPDRVAQLRGELGIRVVKGKTLEQWQYEVTSGGRIWYCPDDAERIVYITHAACGHPRQTGR